MKLRSQQQGIALVITLIMLAVTLVMAVAFLAISTRERGSVSTSTDSTHAREAAEAALAHAEAQVLANILAATNPYNFGLLVSTNYINPYGFQEGVSDPTNVNYDFRSAGGPYSPADLQQNIANLLYLPRAPVYVPTNTTGGYDFRYYLDLNRNGRFDPNNNVSNWVYNGATVNYLSNSITEVGDPEWIGVLEHPDQPHGPLNKFIARYAFIAIPVGNTLDVNAMYNDARQPDNLLSDGFLRNEGVGSWELNLAAFLADLNTNEWDNPNFGNAYNYKEPYANGNPNAIVNANSGSAFSDALSILRYRYNYNVNYQANVKQYTNYNTAGFINAFTTIDEFSDGTLMTNNNLPFQTYTTSAPWAGSDNTNAFFTLSDFFNTSLFRPVNYTAGTPDFADRLLQAGTNTYGTANVPTYDRYTFYRMLSELGTESTPDYGKMNLNFVNVDNNENVVPGAETNFVPWTPLQFFTTAADRMLRYYTARWANTNFYAYTNTFGASTTNAFGVANIPVWVNGQFAYSSSVQRILQLAANMYDASTTNFYPDVFRPRFTRDAFNNVTIAGYDLVSSVAGPTDPQYFTQPFDASAFAITGGSNMAVNVYGIPWIIGAKKGFPNFNEFSLESVAQVTRKIEVVKDAPGSANFISTNVAWELGITNAIGVECWNSYAAAYPYTNNFTISVADSLKMTLELTNGTTILVTNYSSLGVWPGPANLSWAGSTWGNGVPRSALDSSAASPFQIPLNNNIMFLTNSYYDFGRNALIPATGGQDEFQPLLNAGTLRQMVLLTTNRFQLAMLDGSHVIDYVQFAGPDSATNMTSIFQETGTAVGYTNWWSTNTVATGLLKNLPVGIASQMYVSFTIIPTSPDDSGYWGAAGIDKSDAEDMIEGFAQFLGIGSPYPNTVGDAKEKQIATNVIAQCPYTPTVSFYNYVTYQANDPLVHYLTNDLGFAGTDVNLPTGLHLWPLQADSTANSAIPILPDLGNLNQRYAPWGVRGLIPPNGDSNTNNLAYKDPLVGGSDDWDFPTNLYPTVGWLGRVHRGTPWQTVYLKSTNILSLNNFKEGNNTIANGLTTWAYWTGNYNAVDATNTAPVNDRLLFDLFTTAPNENATRGQLSINQPHLAAWSAVFSGLPIFTNLAGTNLTISQPAGPTFTNYVPYNGTNYLGFIWNSIQQTRANTNLFSGQEFVHVGDILATPALSDSSPFLQLVSPSTGISDQMYEWLPQQIMSLVKVGTPRYVVYCYGQALKPAPNGLVTSGANALMCTNYQIVAESAVRAVVEVVNPNSAAPQIVLKNLNPLPPDQ